MIDPAERFQSELTVLRDGAVRALREDNISDVKEGLDLYSCLITTVLDEFRRFEAIVGPSGMGLRSFYGPEMSWLEDDITTFLRTASTEPSSDATQKVLSFLFDLLTKAFNRKELPAFGSFLQKYRFAWSSAKHGGPPEGWEGTRFNILLTFENFGDYRVGRELRRSTEQAKAATPFALRLVAELTELMKQAVDDGSAEDLGAAAGALNETMTFALQRLEERHDLRKDPDPASPALSIERLNAAAFLAIESWIVFRYDAGKADDPVAHNLLGAIREASTSPRWLGYLAAKDDATSDLLGWTWWETQLWTNRRAGILTFHEFIDKTFTAQLIDGRAELPSTLDQPNPEVRYRLEHLEALVQELAAQDPPRPPLVGPADPIRVRAEQEHLKHLRTELVASEDDALIALDLVPARIEQFRRAVIEAWKNRRHFRSLVSSSLWRPAPAESSGEDPLERRPEGFGSNNRLAQKTYFVELESVQADPTELGREFGDGLGRGEGALILSQLQSTLNTIITPLNGFADEVERTVQTLKDRGLSPIVLIINSWELLSALRDHTVQPEGPVWATADLAEAPRLKRTKAPLLLRYEQGADVCIVADFRAALAIRHSPAQPEMPGDVIREDARLLTGVTPLDVPRALEILAATERSEQSNSTGLSEDERIRGILKQVHVRVVEWIMVEILDPAAGAIIRVQEIGEHDDRL